MTSLGAVILAAGQGYRMHSDTPKVLHKLAGMSMLDYVLNSVLSIGPDHTAVVVNSAIQPYLCGHIDGEIGLLEQTSPTGTADAVKIAEIFFKDQVDHLLVIGSDCPLITSNSLQQLIDFHISEDTCISLLSSSLCSSDDMGSINRDANGVITSVKERKYSSSEAAHNTVSPELNSGIYCFNSLWLWDQLKTIKRASSGEFHLPDLIATAYAQKRPARSVEPSDPVEIFGVNTMGQLAQAESLIYQRHNQALMDKGVRIHDPASVFIDSIAVISNSAEVRSNTIIKGTTCVGPKTILGPNSNISDSSIGEESCFENSSCVSTTIGKNVAVGPYCHLRSGTEVGDDAVIGTGVEIKNSQIGKRSRIHHFSYIGDCEIGSDVNVGAGTVTCNYDGKEKHKTVIKDGAFIGSGSMLVAPVVIGRMATTGAGSVVVKDVPEKTLVYGVPASDHKQNPTNSHDGDDYA